MKKGIYILPSLCTLGNLAMGYLSIIYSMNNKFYPAAWFIIIAGIFDMFDGRIARLTNSVSNFGIELDSLCDIVSFGVATSFLMYKFVLYKNIKIGVIIAVFFVIAAALRLARFNVNVLKGNDDGGHFFGLPVPAAAYILASFVLMDILIKNHISKKIIPFFVKKFDTFESFIPLIMVFISFAMVSNINYFSLKKLKLCRAKSFRTIVLFCIGGILVFRYPENMIFIVFSLYFLSGFFDVFKKLKKLSKIFNKNSIDKEDK